MFQIVLFINDHRKKADFIVSAIMSKMNLHFDGIYTRAKQNENLYTISYE